LSGIFTGIINVNRTFRALVKLLGTVGFITFTMMEVVLCALGLIFVAFMIAKGGGGSVRDDSVDDDGIRRANAMNHNSADPLTQTEFPDAALGNTSLLLDKLNGVSYGNLGRLCYFRDLAFPHKCVIKFMQTTIRPVQYLAAEKLDAMNSMFLSGRTVGGQLFLDFKKGLRKSHAALSPQAKTDVEALIERLETESKSV
jgi:hypothetical protein